MTQRRRQTVKIVWHCSATGPDADIGADEIDSWHRAKNWRCIGYHAVIRRDGRIEFGRHFDEPGAHVQGWNTRTVGVCLVGGVTADGIPFCNFTPAQEQAAMALSHVLDLAYPDAEHCGHRDLSPDLDGDGEIEEQEWMKACPSFDVEYWLHTNLMAFRRPDGWTPELHRQSLRDQTLAPGPATPDQ